MDLGNKEKVGKGYEEKIVGSKENQGREVTQDDNKTYYSLGVLPL